MNADIFWKNINNEIKVFVYTDFVMNTLQKNISFYYLKDRINVCEHLPLLLTVKSLVDKEKRLNCIL